MAPRRETAASDDGATSSDATTGTVADGGEPLSADGADGGQTGRAWSTYGLVAGTSLVSVGLAAYEIVPANVTPLIRDSFVIGSTRAGLIVGVFPGVGVLSRISSGLLSDRVFDGRRAPVFLGSFAVVTPMLLVFTRLGSVPLLVGVLFCAGFAIQLTLGLSFTYAREVVETNAAATAVAFQTSVGLAGAFLSPIAGGAVVDAAGFEIVFLLAGALAVLGTVAAWRVPEPT